MKELAARSAADAELVERHRKGMDDELARIRSTIGQTAEALRPLASMIRERAEIEAKDATWYRAALEHQLQQIRDLHNDLQTNAASLIKFISGNLSNGA